MSDVHGPDLRVGFYGDDFTGSVDVLLQFARAGWSSRLFVTLPSAGVLADAASGVDAVGVAGIARSLAPDDLDAEVRPVLEALRDLGPAVVQYKACSTADSSPTVGSLGRVIDIAGDVFARATVPVAFAQPDFGRFTAFGHHFAAEGGTVHRLDRQPTMANHPSTPMTESDLARHLSAQTAQPVGAVHLTEYTDAAGVAHAMTERSAAAVVLDALDDTHLELVARASLELPGSGPVFAIGSGGFSTGFARALGGRAGEVALEVRPGGGPVLVVSGSRSPQTARQIDHVRGLGWEVLSLPLGSSVGAPGAAVSGSESPAAVILPAVREALAAGRSVVVSTADAVAVDRATLVEEIAASLTEIVSAVAHDGLSSRVIVCGGDTSSRLVRAIGAESLRLVANPFGNVVMCALSSDDPAIDGLEIVLKGGQVGPVDLFETIHTLG